MKLPVSKRLLACCGFISQNERVADIGCDHGYLAIHLLLTGKARCVIASDINEAPLRSAMRNAEKYGVRDKMTFYLSDGVQNIPRDFDVLVCAGMGADTMISILDAAPWLKQDRYRLILQCQSKTPMLRRYLSDNSWRITEETVLRDGKFLYTVMEVHFQPGFALTPGQCYFPPSLLENPAMALPDYYHWVLNGLKISAAHQDKPELHAALQEVEQMAKLPELSFLEEY